MGEHLDLGSSGNLGLTQEKRDNESGRSPGNLGFLGKGGFVPQFPHRIAPGGIFGINPLGASAGPVEESHGICGICGICDSAPRCHRHPRLRLFQEKPRMETRRVQTSRGWICDPKSQPQIPNPRLCTPNPKCDPKLQIPNPKPDP